VKLVAVTGGANVTGNMPDVHRLAVKAHAAGARFLVDCAQLAPHRTIEMGSLDDPAHLDYVTLSAHKMYAPFGTGALIGRRDTFEQGEPEYRGGGTIAFVSRDRVAWAAAPDRDEAGTPNVVGAVALAAAIKALQRIGMTAIARHEAALTRYALARLSHVEGLRLYGDSDPLGTRRRLGVIPFNLDGLSHQLVAAILGSEHGIGVRNGCFCAQPYLHHLLGITDARPGDDPCAAPGMVRISFGMYNTFAEIDAVVEALWRIARRKHRGTYDQDPRTGEYRARGWAPEVATCFTLR
jgi:selenocysteine lyase/cysteine desulfurase